MGILVYLIMDYTRQLTRGHSYHADEEHDDQEEKNMCLIEHLNQLRRGSENSLRYLCHVPRDQSHECVVWRACACMNACKRMLYVCTSAVARDVFGAES